MLISDRYFDTMHASVDDMNLSIGAAVVLMNQLITKIQQLNEDMKPGMLLFFYFFICARLLRLLLC